MLTPCVQPFQGVVEERNILLSGLNCEDVLPTSAPAPPPRARPSSGLLHAARLVAEYEGQCKRPYPGREDALHGTCSSSLVSLSYLPHKVLRHHQNAVAHLEASNQHLLSRLRSCPTCWHMAPGSGQVAAPSRVDQSPQAPTVELWRFSASLSPPSETRNPMSSTNSSTRAHELTRWRRASDAGAACGRRRRSMRAVPVAAAEARKSPPSSRVSLQKG